MAIAQYHSIAGVTWCAPLELWNWISRHRGTRASLADEMTRRIPWYLDRYGDQPFGVVDIPTDELLLRIMEGFQVAEFHGDWTTYHSWYMSFGTTPDHDMTRPLWPVCLAIDHPDNEALEDGWHRLHDYVRKGVRVIPGVYTPYRVAAPVKVMNLRTRESLAMA